MKRFLAMLYALMAGGLAISVSLVPHALAAAGTHSGGALSQN
ncbi:MAG TPA: hypothetical protein VH500_17710 [Nitrososphaeraceae archaeon]